MILTAFIVLIIFSYLIGSVNTSLVLSKFVFRSDIRNSGSGNAGATNMLRTHGKGAGALTLAGDMLKGVIAVFAGVLLERIFVWNTVPRELVMPGAAAFYGVPMVFGREESLNIVRYLLPVFPYAAGLFVMIGHIFPVFFRFRGGKGVATAAAVILSLDWKVGVAVLAIALITMAVSRYVSLGSIFGAAAYPLIVLGILLSNFEYENIVHLIFAVVVGGLCILKHSANIKRLIRGEENKLGSKKEE